MYYAKLTRPNSGYNSDIENAKALDAETIYEVEYVSIGGWISYANFKGIKGRFNTVQFDFYNEDMNLIDIIDTEYNHYRSLSK